MVRISYFVHIQAVPPQTKLISYLKNDIQSLMNTTVSSSPCLVL